MCLCLEIMKKFNVGLVGAGFMGRMHAEVLGVLETTELKVVCDIRTEQAKEIAGSGAQTTDSFDKLLADPIIDVIDICLPTYLHADFTIKALEAGKHVVCEKPMAMTVEEGKRMIVAAEQNNRRLMIAHCIRFWPEYEILTDLVKTGKLGKLLSLNLTRYGAFPTWSAGNWLTDESKSGGGALDMHIHDTDYALYLLGKPDEMHSRGSVDERGASHAFTTMTFGKVVVQCEGGWNLPSTAPFKMAYRAIFERGLANFDGGPLTIYEQGKEPVIPEVPRMASKSAGGNISDLGGYYYEMAYFYQQLAENQPQTKLTPQSSLDSLATCLEEIRQIKGAA